MNAGPTGDGVRSGPVGDGPWAALRAATRARVGLGRAGDGLPTAETLRLAAAHAMARDAVHEPLDVDAVADDLSRHGDVLRVRSAVADRAEYLQRPDLGRRLAGASRDLLVERAPDPAPDLVVVVADGLSPRGVGAHAAGLLDALLPRLPDATLGPLVLAEQARVALGDEIAELLGARMLLVLVGERPGMSSPDSLGAYLTHSPRVGRADSERNCVSNVRPPDGLGHDDAAETLAALMSASWRLGLSGVGLKDTGPALPVTDPAPAR